MPATATLKIVTMFSPFDDTEGEFLRFIQSAKRSLYCVIYGFHLPKLTDSLIALHAAGVNVNIILDHSQEQGKAERGEVQRLIDAGVGVLTGTSPVAGQIIHSKFTVIDETAVEFGSWNYSLSASKQSNTVSIVEDAEYAKAFLTHYHRLHGFIVLHQMAYQQQSQVEASDVPQADILADATAGVADPAPVVAAPVAPAVATSAPAAVRRTVKRTPRVIVRHVKSVAA